MAGKLVGYALLTAATFAEGPPSGAQLDPTRTPGISLPFEKQPVQGISGMVATEDGSVLALLDNGYATLENSADFLLRIYKLKLDLRTSTGGSGQVKVEGFIELKDPHHHLPYVLTHEHTQERLLTGADLDPESMVRAPDGSLWIGDEFGPFLIHVSAEGVVLEPPLQLPDVSLPGAKLNSPQSPLLEEGSGVRLMHMLRAHARLHESTLTPLFSPHQLLLQDGNPKVEHPTRREQGQNGQVGISRALFDVSSFQTAGYAVLPWTVNDEDRMLELMRLGVRGLISDRPELLLNAVRRFDANQDGLPGDFLTSEGLIDLKRFDAQGHRGARDLRPENTLPAMEAALDHLMTTLELDVGLTADGVPLLSHEPTLSARTCRLSDGSPYAEEDALVIKQYKVKALQQRVICDKLSRPGQSADPRLSPVAHAFVKAQGLEQVYSPPTLDQVFEFTRFYATYYRTGPGTVHLQASQRAVNAEQVRFNIEPKRNPRKTPLIGGRTPESLTVDAKSLAIAVGTRISRAKLESRSVLQSFDVATILASQEKFPRLQTALLIGDFPTSEPGGDGTNLEPEGQSSSPFFAGMSWPYRQTLLNRPTRVASSGGLEGIGILPDGSALLLLLEKPLAGESKRRLELHRFDLKTRQWSESPLYYPLEPQGKAVGEFVVLDAQTALTIERDDKQGTVEAFKRIYRVSLTPVDGLLPKQELFNLMQLKDPDQLNRGSLEDFGTSVEHYAFPYWTPEALLPRPNGQVLVVNDNNFPFGRGRHVSTGQPDDTEFILLSEE